LAADVLLNAGVRDFTLNAGGDIFIADGVTDAVNWRIGISKTVSIASPEAGVLTVLDLKGTGFNSMATSGSAERGLHIWNPKAPGKKSAQELLQVSVIAKDLVTADVWATAAFAEGIRAVSHLTEVPDIQALFIFADGQITGTPGVIELFAKPEL
jgi:thiamine biosynthesis lipoprotein